MVQEELLEDVGGEALGKVGDAEEEGDDAGEGGAAGSQAAHKKREEGLAGLPEDREGVDDGKRKGKGVGADEVGVDVGEDTEKAETVGDVLGDVGLNVLDKVRGTGVLNKGERGVGIVGKKAVRNAVEVGVVEVDGVLGVP